MNKDQIIILSVFLGYLLFNVILSFVYSKGRKTIERFFGGEVFHWRKKYERYRSCYDDHGNLYVCKFFHLRTRGSGTYLWLCTGVDCSNTGSGYIPCAWRVGE